MPHMKPVALSQTIAAVGHDPATQELHVDWKSGQTSVYSGVSAELAKKVMTAHSVGSALHALVKTQGYGHRYL